MRSTDGLKRGVEAIDLGTQLWYLLVPNIRSNFNVIGEPVDEQGDVS
jgi:F0F1-type ATP synthase beta subunit